MTTTSTRLRRHINAPRAKVYRALLDPQAVAKWMVPNGMTSQVHEFDARVGGSFRVSLTCDAPTVTGKTTAQTDTYHGHFVKLVPNEEVVEVMEFETTDPALQGERGSPLRSPKRMAARRCWESMITCLPASRPLIMKPAGGWR